MVGEHARIDAADAAYLNASYGHGFEYDDVAGNAHPGCCVVPVAIAVGEEVGATLEQVLVAMVAGYETYVRIGRIGSPDLLNHGWQPHSVLANFGAAAVAAKLHGFDIEQHTSRAGHRHEPLLGHHRVHLHRRIDQARACRHRRAQRHRVGGAGGRRHHRPAALAHRQQGLLQNLHSQGHRRRGARRVRARPAAAD